MSPLRHAHVARAISMRPNARYEDCRVGPDQRRKAPHIVELPWVFDGQSREKKARRCSLGARIRVALRPPMPIRTSKDVRMNLVAQYLRTRPAHFVLQHP